MQLNEPENRHIQLKWFKVVEVARNVFRLPKEIKLGRPSPTRTRHSENKKLTKVTIHAFHRRRNT